MKRNIIIRACFAVIFSAAWLLASAQNIPSLGSISDVYLFNGSGSNTVLVPVISDGGDADGLTLTASCDNEALVTVGEVNFDPRNTIGTLELLVNGINGSAELTVILTNSTGFITENFTVTVGPYTNNGINFEVHDIVFWQEVIPLDGVPVFDTVIQTTEAPYDEIDFNSLDITVDEVKDDFFTGFYYGYLVPEVTADYKFSFLSENDGGVWLGETFETAEPLAVRSDNHGSHGTVAPENNKITESASVSLEAGKVYAIYGVQWIVHATYGGIMWEGGGNPRSYIQGEYLFTSYDTEKPAIPSGLTAQTVSVNGLRFAWDASTDNDAVEGYNIYLNGQQLNNAPFEGTNSSIDTLRAETKYSIVVTAVDASGNESEPSEILTIDTYQVDNIAPTPPTNISIVNNAGLSMEIEWTGAVDGETTVIGYNIYVDGTLFNTNDYVYSTDFILTGLSPETAYEITIESVDAGYNISEPSAATTLTTSAFDPLGDNLGVKAGTMTFGLELQSYSHGIGINPNFKNGDVFNSAHASMFDELKPAAIRWGALTANPLNFSSYVGTGKSVTIAKFMDLCNQYDAYTVFCSGVKDNTDWRSDMNTFLHFLEYMAGPSGTTYGDMRIAEGYTNSLLESSRGLIFEFGNEVWGGISHEAEIGENYNNYAAWAREVALLMKSSPYYDPEKIKLVYSGRYPDPNRSYGLNEKLLTGEEGEVDLLAFSGYLGGNLDYDPAIPMGNSELDYYRNSYELLAANISGLDHYARMSLTVIDEIKSSYLYEANMTTPAYNGRHGQALVNSDYYLTAVEHGSIIPSVYHLTHGQWRITNPNNGYERLPLFMTSALINKYCRGYLLPVSYTSGDSLITSDAEVVDLPSVGCHMYQDEGNYTVVLCSRDFSADHIVKLDIPDDLNFSSSAKMYSVTADGFSSRTSVVDSTDIELSDGMFVTVPAFGMIFITFTGDDLTTGSMPGLGAFPYKGLTSIEINGETFEITEDKARIEFTAIVEPADAFIQEVKWEYIGDYLGAFLTRTDLSCQVRASGQCDGNGTLTLRATAPGNPEVFDEVTIEVSGQVASECTGIENAGADKISVFPVPADRRVNVELASGEDYHVTVIDIAGSSICDRKACSGRTELQLEDLKAGIYFLNIEVQGRKYARKIVLN